MRVAEQGITYIFGLIALALVVRNGDNVNRIITGSFSGVTSFSMTLLNPMGAVVAR